MTEQAVPTSTWNHNTHYHPLALRHARADGRALDVGCGEGLLTRRLVGAGMARATGIDLDADQVARAQARAGADARLTYTHGDLLDVEIEGAPFDLVTCVATLHHLDLEAGLDRLRAFTAPGGHLVIIGLARPQSALDHVTSLAGIPVAAVARKVRDEWEHDSPVTDATTTYREVRETARRLLPGVRWRRHIYWRYSLVWRAPA